MNEDVEECRVVMFLVCFTQNAAHVLREMFDNIKDMQYAFRISLNASADEMTSVKLVKTTYGCTHDM